MLVSSGKVARMIARPKAWPRAQARRSATTVSMIAASTTNTSQIDQARPSASPAHQPFSDEK
jgi:hypothetical protein